MQRLVLTVLSTAAVCALVSATPALAAGADAHAAANQAQFHPTEMNQHTAWTPNAVAEGEVYPADQAYGRGAAEPAVPLDAAGIIMRLPFERRVAGDGTRDAYAYVPSPYEADNASVPGRLSASAARARCHVVHVQECLRSTSP